MPIAQKSSSKSGGGTVLPPNTGMLDPSELSDQSLTDLGFDPNSLPDPFNYPKGMACALTLDSGDNLVLAPLDQSSNVNNFMGFLAFETPKTATHVTLLSSRGSIVEIFGVGGDTFENTVAVYLSDVVGRVGVQGIPSSGGERLCVGFCISSTEFVLNTDSRANIP